MAHSRDQEEELENLFTLYNELRRESNHSAMQGLKINDELYVLEKAPADPETVLKIKNCNDRLTAIMQERLASDIDKRINDTQEKIKAIDPNALNSPRPSKRP
jgi:hypothetical protein